jgi:hypothetical protein
MPRVTFNIIAEEALACHYGTSFVIFLAYRLLCRDTKLVEIG